MPLSLAKLTANTASATIDFGDGDVLNVTYYPAKITGKMMAELAGVDKEQLAALTPAQTVALVNSPTDILTALLASWDLAEDIAEDGTVTPLPLTRASIESLGISIQWTILSGVMAAQGQGQGQGQAGTNAGEAPAPVNAPVSGAIS